MDVHTKVKKSLEAAIEAKNPNMELIVAPSYSNTGTWYIQPKDGFTQVAAMSYSFQDSSASFEGTTNGQKSRLYCSYADGSLQKFIDLMLSTVPVAKKR